MSETPKFTHKTPSGVPVYVVSIQRNSYSLMSNGAIISPEMVKKWELPKEPEHA